jgi:hypothetical protein
MPIEPRSLKITQTPTVLAPPGTPVRTADLSWRYLLLISEVTGRKLTPSEVLDHMLWGGTVYTERYAYSIEKPELAQQAWNEANVSRDYTRENLAHGGM